MGIFLTSICRLNNYSVTDVRAADWLLAQKVSWLTHRYRTGYDQVACNSSGMTLLKAHPGAQPAHQSFAALA